MKINYRVLCSILMCLVVITVETSDSASNNCCTDSIDFSLDVLQSTIWDTVLESDYDHLMTPSRGFITTDYELEDFMGYTEQPTDLFEIPVYKSQFINENIDDSEKDKRSVHETEEIRENKKIKTEIKNKPATEITSPINRQIERTKQNIYNWNTLRLSNKHRIFSYSGYDPVDNQSYSINCNRNPNEIDSLQQVSYINHCRSIFKTNPTKNELWFIISTLSNNLKRKVSECKALAISTEYKIIEELNDYYPGLLNDIIKYINKNCPLFLDSRETSIQQTESLSDIYTRKYIIPNSELHKRIITRIKNTNHFLLGVSITMILSIDEIAIDLTTISREYIEKVFKNFSNSGYVAVILALHSILEKCTRPSRIDLEEEYRILSKEFSEIIQQNNPSYESSIIKLYTEMYGIVGCFYEIAKTSYLNNHQKLVGKHTIRPQKYFKCTTEISKNMIIDKYNHKITENRNKWIVSPVKNKHYHIHYVDNTKQQYKRLCMPLYFGKNIHTISQIIDYLQKIFKIQNKCIFPYIRNKKTGKWQYIPKNNPNTVVSSCTYYDTVFYYIEEGPVKNYFTLAEFETYRRPNNESVRIPLFLCPLMRSAMRIGPFEQKNNIDHKLIKNILNISTPADAYVYKEEYKDEEYSHMHHYYSNLYIRRNDLDIETIDCYTMNNQISITNSGNVRIDWYVRMPESVDEYTHCILSDEIINNLNEYDKFIKALYTKEYIPDTKIYGIGFNNRTKHISSIETYNSSERRDYIVNIRSNNSNMAIKTVKIKCDSKIDFSKYVINGILQTEAMNTETMQIERVLSGTNPESENKNRSELKRLLTTKIDTNLAIANEEYYVSYFQLYNFIIVRCCNTHTKSSLGIHNEILNALISTH